MYVLSSALNPQYSPAAVPPPSGEAFAFHRALPGYAPTPLRDLGGGVWLKDESDRFGLPAFKVLGVSWAVERALREDPGIETLVAASAGNHGRAVAHVAARRGLRARVFLPARSVAARREAIAGEGADVVVVDGHATRTRSASPRRRARARARSSWPTSAPPAPRTGSSTATPTLFAELNQELRHDLRAGGCRVARRGRARGTAAATGDGRDRRRAGRRRLPHRLAARPGEPTVVDTPGTAMAGLDCAAVSEAAWPTLKHGITGTVTGVGGADRRRDARARRARPRHRALRRRDARGPARRHRVRRSSASACCSSPPRARRTPRATGP